MKLLAKSLLVMASTLAASSAFALDGQALANSKACLACHNVDQKLIGPAFKDVAAKYGNSEQGIASIMASIKGGSQGKWGPVPMPANPVNDEEAKALATWIASLK